MGNRENLIRLNYEIERALREPSYTENRAQNIEKAMDALNQSRQTRDVKIKAFLENACLGFLLRK